MNPEVVSLSSDFIQVVNESLSMIPLDLSEYENITSVIITDDLRLVDMDKVSSSKGILLIDNNPVITTHKENILVWEINFTEITPFLLNFKLSVLNKLITKEVLRSTSFQNLDRPSLEDKNTIIFITGSAGAPRMITDILTSLHKNIHPIIVVQHISRSFDKRFVNRINSKGKINAVLVSSSSQLKDNQIYVAPADYHIEIINSPKGFIVKKSEGSKVNFTRPSADVTLFSMARLSSLIPLVVVMSGMGRDGREGIRILKRENPDTVVIALDEDESPVNGMNREVIKSNFADYVLTTTQIISFIQRFRA